MNKRVLAVLFAGLVLASAVACTKVPSETVTETVGETVPNNPNYVIDASTTADKGSVATSSVSDETLEADPVFSDVSMTLYVYVANGNIRSKTETALTDAAICGYVQEGDTLAATGESMEWYRVLYNEKTCYIRKSIVCDNALIDAFTDVKEQITVSSNVNVRSLPKVIETSGTDLSIRGTLKKGTTVTRTGVGKNWSRILYSYTYTDKDGKSVTEDREYYISNDCIADTATSTESVKS
jgi:hypothetical protein